MLYQLFRFLFYLTTKAYFRSIYVKGRENIPAKGPVVFAANHNSAFMDPILMGVEIKRALYFLARGDVFKNPLAAAFFKQLNMIPVYKPDLTPDEMHKNEFIFQKCFEHLKNQKTIVIFPEGVSRTERRLRPIKTGVSRISLGAEKENDFNLGVTIVPIGINYSNPHFYRSDVFVNFGEPIRVSDYKDVYQNDEKEGVYALTDRVKEELENLLVIVEDERLDKLIKEIEVLYRSKLRDDSNLKEKAPQDFYLSKDIVKAVEYFAEQEPERLRNFEQKIDTYLKGLKRLKIRDTQVRSSKVSFNIFWYALFFTLTSPLFAYGFLVNVLPFYIGDRIARLEMIREDFVGSIKMAAGMFVYLIVYALQGLLLGWWLGGWWALFLVLSFYPRRIVHHQLHQALLPNARIV